MSTGLLQLQDVVLGHGARSQALQTSESFSLLVSPRERLAILGPSGAGKSTLLHLMSLDLPPLKGSVTFKGRVSADWSVAELSRHRAVMPQNGQVAFGLEVHLVIALGRVARAQDPCVAAIVAAAAQLACVDHLLWRRCDTLSGGELARVHLARIFAQMWDVRDSLILIDEPLAALDLGLQVRILQSLDTFAAERHHAVVAVLHDVNHALKAFDRLVLVKEGRLFADVPSNDQAVLLFERLYGLRLESLRTADRSLVVLPASTRCQCP
jgi:iron complex transport system ATP-binding protein